MLAQVGAAERGCRVAMAWQRRSSAHVMVLGLAGVVALVVAEPCTASVDDQERVSVVGDEGSVTGCTSSA